MSIDALIRRKFTKEEIELGNSRFLELADFVERYQSTGAVNGYNQTFINHSCGAPACMLGHAGVLWPKELGNVVIDGLEYEFFAISPAGWSMIFSAEGCGDAHEDWRKAVAFVRQFVTDRKVALAEGLLS